MRSDSRSPGFTLIEVLIAVLIVSLVFGLLLQSVTRNLADLSRSRAESRSAQLAAQRVRDMKIEIEAGQKLEDGVKEGVFEEPDDDLRWQISVAPQTLPLPPDYKGELPPSTLFAAANEPPRAPTPGEDPPLRMVQVRVYRADEDPETVDPFVVLLTAPPSAAQLSQLQQQQQQQQQQGTNAAGAGGATQSQTGTASGMGTRSGRPQ